MSDAFIQKLSNLLDGFIDVPACEPTRFNEFCEAVDTLHKADISRAKLEAALAMREAASKHRFQVCEGAVGKFWRCQCGVELGTDCSAAVMEWEGHIRSLDLAPAEQKTLEGLLGDAEWRGVCSMESMVRVAIPTFNKGAVLSSINEHFDRLLRAERASAYRRCASNLPSHPHLAGVFLKWADECELKAAEGSEK